VTKFVSILNEDFGLAIEILGGMPQTKLTSRQVSGLNEDFVRKFAKEKHKLTLWQKVTT
jgi:hypothetical protein